MEETSSNLYHEADKIKERNPGKVRIASNSFLLRLIKYLDAKTK